MSDDTIEGVQAPAAEPITREEPQPIEATPPVTDQAEQPEASLISRLEARIVALEGALASAIHERLRALETACGIR